MSFASTRTSDKIARLEKGADADLRARPRSGRRCQPPRRPSVFHRQSDAAVAGADAVFIAVGTPSRRGDGHADLSYVFGAAEEIAQALTAIPSSSPNRPCRSAPAAASPKSSARPGPDAQFDVVSNPEFLREGSAIQDFMRPDRVVIGCESDRAAAVMRELYRPLYLIEVPMIFTALETAELTKYAANTFLATKISFINEIADLCETRRRRCPRRRPRHRAGRPHRPQIPSCRTGLWRLMLSQGLPGADPHRAPSTARRRASSRWRRR